MKGCDEGIEPQGGHGGGGGMELVRGSLGSEAGGTRWESSNFTDWRELLGG